MTENYVTVKDVSLNNNCPECFSKDGLRLVFKQRIVETTFYKSITKDFKKELTCNTCNNIIYPVNWTDDIERVLEYQEKAFTLKKASTYFKTPFWIAVSLISILITAIIVAAFIL